MSYADSLLVSGERIIRIAHQHWFVLVWRARWAILALIIAALAGGFRVINSNDDNFLWTVLGWIVLILLVVGIASVIYGLLTYRAEEFVITNRRIIHAEGVINKQATDSSLEKINDAVLRESIFGRIFGFGDLEVLTASESGIERLKMLRDAKEFKKSMLEAKHELELELGRPVMPPMRAAEGAAPVAASETAPSPASAPVAPAAVMPVVDDATAPVNTADEVANALARLGTLRDQGVITPAEFEAKKAELLGRL